VKAYFALKLAGCSADAPFMHEARANIMRLGGIPQMNTFSKLYLALLGTISMEVFADDPLLKWRSCRAGRRFTFTKCRRGAGPCLCRWLSSITSNRLEFCLEKSSCTSSIPSAPSKSDLRLPRSERFWTWRNFFLRVEDVLNSCTRLGFDRCAGDALEKAERWMVERIGEGSDGLAAVYPAMLNSLIALRALGYSKTNPVYAKAEKDFAGLFVDDPRIFAHNRVCRRIGTLRSTSSRWRNPAFPRSIPRCKRPPIG
jgi:squalene-hopene/tetraprenyl-beta-curcumene cyclase